MGVSDLLTDDATTEPSRLKYDALQRSDNGGDPRQLPQIKRPLGFILDEPDETKVAKHVVKLREDQAPEIARDRAVWTCNRWWREGKRWVRLQKSENYSSWKAVLPVGMQNAPRVPNKTDRLCRRVTNTLLVDKPYPNCEPGDDSNEARDNAEFSTRFLAVRVQEALL